MKLLIGGKSRNIYMRKDGSAYYKSGGQQVDVTHMFKKNGGGLKKQYIGGVEDNVAKVERKKKLNKCAKQILGGVISDIKFDAIAIKSEEIIDNSYEKKTAPGQLKKICCLALYGLGAAMTDELKKDQDKDKIKVSVGKDLETFVKYLQKLVPDGTAKTQIEEITAGDDKVVVFKRNVVKAELKEFIKTLGFDNVTADTDFTEDDKCVTVTRAYILNKILQCFEGDGHFIADSVDLPPSDSSRLTDKIKFIDPIEGTFNPDDDIKNKVQKVFNNIYKVSRETDPNSIEKSATNLHTVLFSEEQIGAPSS